MGCRRAGRAEESICSSWGGLCPDQGSVQGFGFRDYFAFLGMRSDGIGRERNTCATAGAASEKHLSSRAWVEHYERKNPMELGGQLPTPAPAPGPPPALPLLLLLFWNYYDDDDYDCRLSYSGY